MLSTKSRQTFGKSNQGYSVLELLVVFGVLGVGMAISVPYFLNYTKRMATEDQTIKVIDLMRETAQMALTRRRTFRFELDTTDFNQPVARIFDEAGPDPDVLVKSIPLKPSSSVRFDQLPLSVDTGSLRYPAFPVAGVAAARFRSDGSVLNNDDALISGTLIFWAPKDHPFSAGDLNPRSLGEVRAISLYGGTGAMQALKYDGEKFVPWQ